MTWLRHNWSPTEVIKLHHFSFIGVFYLFSLISHFFLIGLSKLLGVPSRRMETGEENYDSLTNLCSFFTNNSHRILHFVKKALYKLSLQRCWACPEWVSPQILCLESQPNYQGLCLFLQILQILKTSRLFENRREKVRQTTCNKDKEHAQQSPKEDPVVSNLFRKTGLKQCEVVIVTSFFIAFYIYFYSIFLVSHIVSL